MKDLTGQALAEECTRYLKRVWIGESANVWVHDLGGGWLELRGESLPPHETLKAVYPNGWSLCDRIRYGEARARLNTWTSQR